MKYRFSGGEGTDSGGIPILEDSMRFVDSAINDKEAEWAESMRLTREDVAAAYHVNPSIVWSNDGQTYASTRVRECARSLYADTLGPLLRLVQDGIRSKLVPMIGADQKSYAEFDITAKLAGSFEGQASVLSTSTGGPWMTRNEARARQNPPAIEGGDELIVPMNVTEGGLASPTDTDPTQAYSAGPMAKALAGAPGRRHGAGSPRLRARPGEGDVERVEEALEAFYRRQGASLADEALRMGAEDIVLSADADWLDGPRWTDELCDDLFDAMSGLAPAWAADAMTSLGADAGHLDEDAVLAEVRRLSRFRAADIVRSASERVVSDLGDLDELTPRGAIEATTRRLIASRVGRNGRSITSAAANGATVTGARQSGVECQKEWVAGPNARATHAAMNGQRVPIGGRFSNQARWPGDTNLSAAESCDCNCRIEIVSGEGRSKDSRGSKVRKREAGIQRETDKRYREYKSGMNELSERDREARYRRAMGEYVGSFTVEGKVSAKYQAEPWAKELQTTQTLSELGHSVEFLPSTGGGRHPDAMLDGVITDFKRVEAFDPDRVFKLIRKAGSQGAEIVVIDLCLDTVSLDAALEKAAKAVRLGFVEEGHVIVLDWNSEEHVV